MAGEGVEVSPTCIGQLWVFANLQQPEISAVVKSALRRRLNRGQYVFMQGDPSCEISLIKAGRVKLSKIMEDGSEITLDMRKGGDFLGENMLSEETDYPVSAWCMEDVLVCSFTKERFERLVLEHPNIGLQVIKNLSTRINWLTNRIGSLSLTNLEDRLHRVLMNVAREHGVKSAEGFTIQFPLTHEDLSFLTGAHRVSITRAMKSLKEAGKIIQHGRALTLPFEAEWI
jgi:CRP/FNR family transcriptional regulator